MIQAIVFDFDNVIVQGSEACKDDSWSKIFDPDSAEYARLKKSQKRGGDRFDILADTLELADKEDRRDRPEVLRLADRYDSFVQEAIVSIGIDQNNLIVLEKLTLSYPLYIISATPERYLHATIKKLGELHKRDLFKLFQLVLGTPLSKVDNFAKVQDHSKLPYADMLMIGDGVNDLAAARIVGAKFVGVITDGNTDVWKNETFPKVSALRELPEILNTI